MNRAIKRFVRECRNVGASYHEWGWTQRLTWASEALVGTHTYKGVQIPSSIDKVLPRAFAIARRAQARQA